VRYASQLALAALLMACNVRAASNLRRPAGRHVADFDGKSFKVGERRVLLRCGGLHYFRIPPTEWADRLLQTRLAGFNAIETPVPWSLHEPRKGRFDFQGPADLARFLALCHKAGLMAFVRVGPYVNATLSNGGLPAWLAADTRLKIRSADSRFIEAVRAWWRKLLPILARDQAPNGPVVMLQVEDHYKGPERTYLPRLYDEIVAAGLRVPVVLSDLNSCTDFQRARVTDDLFYATTRLLPAPPLAWGQGHRTFAHFDDLLIEGLARGIDGYNHAMWAAGTHLALLPATSFPTRFEAATSGILEGGAHSRVYAQAKEVNLFAEALETVFTQAVTLRNGPLLDQARRGGLVAYGRIHQKTTVLFAKRRYGQGETTFTDPASGQTAKLRLDDRRFRHIIAGLPLTPKTTLALSTAQVLTIRKMRDRLLVVAYAPTNAEATMVIATPRRPGVVLGAKAATWNASRKQLVVTWRSDPARGPLDIVVNADQRIHIVALDETHAPTTWALDGAGVLIGAPAIGQWRGAAPLRIQVRLPIQRGRYKLTFYPDAALRAVAKADGVSNTRYDKAARRIDLALATDNSRPTPVLLYRWQMAADLAEVAPGFDDKRWAESSHPLPLGDAGHGWYRCRFESPKAKRAKLVFENFADSVTLYLNGQYVDQSPTKRLVDAPRRFRNSATFDVQVARGDNVLAVLVKNWGRYRNSSSYATPLVKASGWGLLGKVTLGGRSLMPWRSHAGLSPAGRSLQWGSVSDAGGPVRWYRNSFAVRAGKAHLVPRAVLKGLGHGALWLNGHYVGLYHQRAYDAGHGTYLPPAWLKAKNELIALEENGRNPKLAELRFDRNASFLPVSLTFRKRAASGN